MSFELSFVRNFGIWVSGGGGQFDGSFRHLGDTLFGWMAKDFSET